jgi:hypothetical protein
MAMAADQEREAAGMKQLSLIVITTVLAATPVHGADPPHLDFVQGLRARGLPDVALDYLENLKNPPAELAARLPLEIAKCRAEMAQIEVDPSRREALYGQARAEFLAFLKNSPKNRMAAQASLDLARITALQGKILLSRAEQKEAPEARQTELDKARVFFEDAAKQFHDAAGRITEQLGTKDLPEEDKNALEKAKTRADLELGIDLLNQFLTYSDEAGEARAATARRALEVLQKTAAGKEKDPLYWVAHAWIGRYYLETQDFQAANKELKKVIEEKSAFADAGKRLARFIRLMVLDKDTTVKDPVPVKVKEAETWLKDYPNHHQTPEGIGVRFYLAEGYFDQAMKKPGSADGLKLFAAAEKLYDGLEKSETDYARRARERKMRIVFTRSWDRSKGDINKLKDFQECYLRAQGEVFLMEEEKKTPPKDAKPADLAKKKKEHQHNMVIALNRALELADDKTPASDLIDARIMLTYVYLHEVDDPYGAAIMGENVARSWSKTKKASAGAAYALDAYYLILSKDEEAEAAPADLEASRSRLRNLAAFMEQNWPADPATDVARYRLGSLALHEKKYPEVVRAFGDITANFPAYSLTQFQLARAAMQAHKDGAPVPSGQPSYQDQAIAALKRIPEVVAGASVANINAYFMGKLDLARLLFATKKYEEMARLTTQLTKSFEGAESKLDKGVVEEIKPVLQVLPVYAQYGLADVQFNKGNFADALTIIEPIVTQIAENKFPTLNDPKGVRNIQGLALRANVQEGNTERAHEILTKMLEKKEDGDLEGTSAILAELVDQLRSQVDQLRDKGPSAQKELNQTIAKFSAFLGELAKQSPDKLGPDLIRFLAFGYAGLQKHEQAAEFLSRIPEPKPTGDKKELDPDKVNFYRGIQVMYVKELRLARRFDKARDELKKILRTDWGQRGFDAKKELNFLWEDEGNFNAAAKGWNDMMTNIRPLIEKNAKFKDLYYECYYHVVYSLYKNALDIKDKTRQRENIRKAANWYVKLKQSKPDMGGEGLKKLYDDLLQSQELFKRECLALEKGE